MMASISTGVASRVSVGRLPPNEPVPSLTRRIIELLGVEKEDLVVDLYSRDLQSPQAMPETIRLRARRIAPSPFSERLAFLLITSGVRMVQMGTLTFGRFPMRYEQVVLRDGFSQFKGSLRRLLATVIRQLDPAGRVLIVDSAPSPDAPLFAEALRRWNRQRCSPGVIAELMREAGFSAQVETVKCLRRVSAAKCYTWVESRDWPILESFHEAELQRGLCELRARYGSQHKVEFTSRFDLVLGTKPETLAS
jgi:hypothetical protein